MTIPFVVFLLCYFAASVRAEVEKDTTESGVIQHETDPYFFLNKKYANNAKLPIRFMEKKKDLRRTLKV